MTQLTPTLYAVEVPMEANNYRIVKTENTYLNFHLQPGKLGGFVLPNLDLKILGEVTKDEINFDVEPFVDTKTYGSYPYF